MRDLAGRRGERNPSQTSTVVVLPAPLGPRIGGHRAAVGGRQGQAVDGPGDLAIALDQASDLHSRFCHAAKVTGITRVSALPRVTPRGYLRYDWCCAKR